MAVGGAGRTGGCSSGRAFRSFLPSFLCTLAHCHLDGSQHWEISRKGPGLVPLTRAFANLFSFLSIRLVAPLGEFSACSPSACASPGETRSPWRDGRVAKEGAASTLQESVAPLGQGGRLARQGRCRFQQRYRN